MTWAMFNTIAIWACALGAITCSLAVTRLINQNRQNLAMLKAAVNGLNDTHMQGLEALTMDIDRLKRRVDALERR